MFWCLCDWSYLSVLTLFSSKRLQTWTGCHPDTWAQNVLWTSNVGLGHICSADTFELQTRKCFFPVKRTGGYQHVSLSLCFGDFIQMDSSDMLNLCAYIETACYYQPGASRQINVYSVAIKVWCWPLCGHSLAVTVVCWGLDKLHFLPLFPGVTISSGTNFTPVSCTGLIHWFS